MTGTAAMSGSEPSRRRKRVIASTPSSIASSMFTSRITAPFVTWSRATATASSSALARPPLADGSLIPVISRANLREPVTLVRSPMLTKAPPGIGIASGSRPARRVEWVPLGTTRGGTPATAATMAAVCSGVLPQHEPARLMRPARAHSPSAVDVSDGVSS